MAPEGFEGLRGDVSKALSKVLSSSETLWLTEEVVGMPGKCVATGVFRRLSMNAGKEASGETSIVGLLLLLFG